MEKGLFIPGITLEELLHKIKNAAKEGAKEEFQRLSSDELLTQEAACIYLNITKPTIIDWAKKCKIFPKKIRGRVYYKKSDLLNINS